jgi:hypothetical protein
MSNDTFINYGFLRNPDALQSIGLLEINDTFNLHGLLVFYIHFMSMG